MAYERKFITLMQEKGDFTQKNTVSMGTCVLEENHAEGKLTINVQNLISEITYKVYLAAVFPDHTLCVKIGSMQVDTKGKGNCRLKFDAVNVDATPYGVKRFSVVLLAAEKGNAMTFVLSGNIGEPVKWRNDYVFADKESDWQRIFETASDGQNGGEANNGDKAEAVVKAEEYSLTEENSEEAGNNRIGAAGTFDTAPEEHELSEQSREITVEVISTDNKENTTETEAVSGCCMESGTESEDDRAEAGSFGANDDRQFERRDNFLECSYTGGDPSFREDETEVDGAGTETSPQAVTQTQENDDFETGCPDVSCKCAEPEAQPESNTETALSDEENKTERDASFPDNPYNVQEIKQEDDGADYVHKRKSKPLPAKETHEKFLRDTQKFNEEMEALEESEFFYNEVIPPNKVRHIDTLFSRNIVMMPFSRQRKDVSWIKISADDLNGLDFLIDSETAECDMVKLGISRYEHLIFGRFIQGEYTRYILGIPDQYKSSMKSSAADLGFFQFKHCIGEMPGENAHGYWLKIL